MDAATNNWPGGFQVARHPEENWIAQFEAPHRITCKSFVRWVQSTPHLSTLAPSVAISGERSVRTASAMLSASSTFPKTISTSVRSRSRASWNTAVNQRSADGSAREIKKGWRAVTACSECNHVKYILPTTELLPNKGLISGILVFLSTLVGKYYGIDTFFRSFDCDDSLHFSYVCPWYRAWADRRIKPDQTRHAIIYPLITSSLDRSIMQYKTKRARVDF